MTRLTLAAPLAGWALPAAEIPDAVFAERMLGDGVAIDPTGAVLHAPCDGEVISIAAARHAIALRHPEGAEVLLHVGIDTVALNGAGFTPHVRKGDQVRAGAPLLSFDLAQVARGAASLVTPIVITNSEQFRIVAATVNRSVAVGDALLELEALGTSAAAPSGAREPVVSEAVVVSHAHGIHARPAARIARVAKTLPFELEARARGRSADPRSGVALMALGVRGGDEIVIAGFSADAAAAVAELVRTIRGLDAAPSHDAGARPESARAPAPAAVSSVAEDGALRGVIANRGFALGAAFRVVAEKLEVAEHGAGVGQERAALGNARARVQERLTRTREKSTGAAAGVLDAHLELLDDPGLLAAAERHIAAGKSAGFAWRASLASSADALRATGDARLAERVADLEDLERQVLGALAGGAGAAAQIPGGAILLAADLTPSELIDIAPGTLAGIVLAHGGPTSHVAILAGVLGIPMLVALGPALLDVVSGTPLVLDADAGRLRVAPSAAELAAAREQLAARRARHDAELAAARRDCHLASGERIEVFANLVGTMADAEIALANGAEGCGLLRTEFLFLDRATAPNEEEQLASYNRVAAVLAGRPLVIRTLDVGGDKPIPYLPLPAEENPALGLRGVRTSLWRPELLRAQVRALLRTQPACRILIPMITDLAELATVRGVIEAARAELGVPRIPLGVMIETPAAALLADQLVRDCDFLSIGTNDLAQYTLAMDRGHAELAARIDGVHPAVLRLIGAVGAAARAAGRPVAVCGGLASDPAAVPLLLGLGVTELSAVAASIPEIKARVAALTLSGCRALASAACALTSAQEVRALLAAKGQPGVSA